MRRTHLPGRPLAAAASTISLLLLSACGGTESIEDTAAQTERRHTVTTFVPSGGGTISPSDATIAHGERSSFIITPNEGFTIESVTGCNGTLAGINYTTEAITEECEIEARFAKKSYTITVSAIGGTVEPDSAIVPFGEAASFTLIPGDNAILESVSGCEGTLRGEVFTLDPVESQCTLFVEFSSQPVDPPPSTIVSLEDQLNELGVDVEGQRNAPRRLDPTTPIEGDWPPLGRLVEITPKELFLVGQTLLRRPVSYFLEIYNESTGSLSPRETFVRHEDYSTMFTGASPDNSGTRPGSQIGRSAAAGDFDGDGNQEVVMLQFFHNERLDTYRMLGVLLEDKAAFNNSSIPNFPMRDLGKTPVIDLELAAGDLTGDDRDDLLVVFLKKNWFGLIPYPGLGNNQFDQRASVGGTPVLLEETDGTRSIEVAVGNLDFDIAKEIVVLVRTWDATLTNGEPSGSAHYYIFDDVQTQPFIVAPMVHSGTLTLPDYDSEGRVSPVTAGLAVADFDGDGLDEIAFAGLTRMRHQDCEENHYGVVVLDDLPHEFEEIEQGSHAATPPNCSYIYEAMAHPIQWDGDHARELLLNEQVIDFGDLGPEVIDTTSVIDFRTQEPFSLYTHAVATADLSGEGLDEIISYSTGGTVLRAEGHERVLEEKENNDEENSDEESDSGSESTGETENGNEENSEGDTVIKIKPFRIELTYPNEGDLDLPRPPLILPFDSDDDGMKLRYVEGSHRLELTEPVIHAVLAAPPCSPDLGQDLSDCTTTFGKSRSTGSEISNTTTGSVSATFGLVTGYGIGPFTFEFSTQATIEAWTSSTTGTGYKLSYTVDYTTQGQDAVIFSSIPYDIYEYEVISHARQPEQVGTRIAFMYPRRPITRPVSVDYFNERVRQGGPHIGSEILSHTVGDPYSYLDPIEMAQKSADRAVLKHGPMDVGASDTLVELEISVTDTDFVEQAYGTSRSVSMEVTGGMVVSGLSVGMEESNTITTTMSESTTFSGAVPGIDNDATSYGFGIFTYMDKTADDDGDVQIFQVINYWVDR